MLGLAFILIDVTLLTVWIDLVLIRLYNVQ